MEAVAAFAMCSVPGVARVLEGRETSTSFCQSSTRTGSRGQAALKGVFFGVWKVRRGKKCSCARMFDIVMKFQVYDVDFHTRVILTSPSVVSYL